MTRVLVLSNFYPPDGHGGYEMSCADVMERLVRRGHEVTVLTSRYSRTGNGTPREEERSGVRVLRGLDLYWDDHRLVIPPRRRRLAVERANQRRLRAALAAARPDVVSVWNMGAMSFGLLTALHRRGTPLVYAVCNDWLVWGPDMDAWSKGLSDRPLLRRLAPALTRAPAGPSDLGTTGTFLFVSDWTRRLAEERSGSHYPDSSVVYSGIAPDDFPVRDDEADRPWSWRLLFAGRLDPDKGVDTCIRALARLPEATLEVIGPGSEQERTRVERMAAELGVGDRMVMDDLARSALATRYRAADVVVFPSRWDEPFGLVPIEAMACGTPVVATRTGGSAEVLLDGVNCIGFGRDDPDGLVRAVLMLAEDEELRRKLTSEGRKTAQALTVDGLADCFEQWLTGAAGGFSDGRPPPRRLALPPARAAG